MFNQTSGPFTPKIQSNHNKIFEVVGVLNLLKLEQKTGWSDRKISAELPKLLEIKQ
jgi:hypothetical protein